jgi:alginate O-acetyltransferase complex protein AlgJ
MTQPSLSPALDRLLAAVFVLAIAVPLVGTIAGVGAEVSDEENREAAPWPGMPHDLTELSGWPEAFTRSFADHVAFRSELVRWHAAVRVEWLKSSPTPDVLLGRDGWLFYGSDGAVEDYAASRPFSEPELAAWRTTLQNTQDWLDAHRVAYVFVVAPDKHWVYPELMPEGISWGPGPSRVDQLIGDLRTHSTVRVVDVRGALRAARGAERLYHLTDTHWNDIGAYVAYEQVMRALEPQVGVGPRPRGELELRRIPRSGMDLARMLGLGRVMVEDDLQLEPKGGRRSRVIEPARPGRALMDARVVTEGPAGAPRALVFRDSFGSAMIPFLSEHFSRAVYVWQNNFDTEIVLDERPAVVIQEWVGRHLYTQAPYDAVAARTSGQE